MCIRDRIKSRLFDSLVFDTARNGGYTAPRYIFQKMVLFPGGLNYTGNKSKQQPSMLLGDIFLAVSDTSIFLVTQYMDFHFTYIGAISMV